MAVTQKTLDIARDLSLLAQHRLPALAFTQGFDTDSCPWFYLGAGVDGGANILVKIAPLSFGPVNPVTGHSANVYVPHVIQIVTEANYAGSDNDVADCLTTAQILPILGDSIRSGCVVEWYNSANGDAPDLNDITPAKLAATYQPPDFSIMKCQ